MDHTKYRDFTFSYIISRFHLENIDVPFLSINGSVVYSSRTSYHAKGLVCNHKNCFAAIRFPSFFCNIRRIAPRVDWTLMERWRKTPAVVSNSMVARRTAPRFDWTFNGTLAETPAVVSTSMVARRAAQPFAPNYDVEAIYDALQYSRSGQ